MATAPRSQEPANPAARYDRIYDLYRNCILNELYYGHRLNLFSRTGFWLEVVVVIGSGTSGVSGWIIWTEYQSFAALWALIAAAATLIAALKPVLQTDARIKRYSQLFSAYRQLALSMHMVVDEIREAGGVSRETDREIDRIRVRYRNLSVDDDPRPNPKLVERLQGEVNKRVPAATLFFPAPPVPPSGPVPSPPAAPAIAGDAEGVDVRIDPVGPWPHGGRDGG